MNWVPSTRRTEAPALLNMNGVLHVCTTEVGLQSQCHYYCRAGIEPTQMLQRRPSLWGLTHNNAFPKLGHLVTALIYIFGNNISAPSFTDIILPGCGLSSLAY